MQEQFMRRALEIASASESEPGALPYGAVVVRDGAIIGEGLNRAMQKHDPTSHGEMEAIRDACVRLASTRLEGCEVYTSCEPCAMCVATMCLCGVERVYYAASADDSSRMFAQLASLDPKWARKLSAAELRTEVGQPLSQSRLRGTQLLAPEGQNVLEHFAGQLIGN